MSGEAPEDDRAKSETPEGGMAQVSPDAAARYRDSETRATLHELTGDLSVLRERTEKMDKRAETDSRRLDGLETKSDKISGRLDELLPKIDDVLGFIKHGMSEVAKKSDIATLDQKIEKRPTRRQSIFDLIAFIGFVGVVIAITLHFAH